MKILYCIASFSGKGGTEKVLSSKANYLAENGHDVMILVSDQHNKPFSYPLSEKVNIIDLAITEKLPKRLKFIGFFQNIIALRKIYKSEILNINPDVIVVLERGYEDFIIPYILKNIPKVREYHFSRHASVLLENKLPKILRYKKKILRKIYERCYKKYDKLVLLTEKDKKSWKDFPNTVVIPNAIEKIDTEIRIITKRPKNIIAVGSMADDRKGFSKMIRIWSQIENKFPEWSFHIFGGGAMKEVYAKQIEQLGPKNIHLRGITNQIQEKYKDSQIFLMTSNGEGLPMVIIEAFSLGLPVIAYDCYCGPSDIIKDDKGGYLIDFDDEEQFLKKLEFLMNNDDVRIMKSSEAQKISKSYYLEEIMPLWLSLFKKISS